MAAWALREEDPHDNYDHPEGANDTGHDEGNRHEHSHWLSSTVRRRQRRRRHWWCRSHNHDRLCHRRSHQKHADIKYRAESRGIMREKSRLRLLGRLGAFSHDGHTNLDRRRRDIELHALWINFELACHALTNCCPIDALDTAGHDHREAYFVRNDHVWREWREGRRRWCGWR